MNLKRGKMLSPSSIIKRKQQMHNDVSYNEDINHFEISRRSRNDTNGGKQSPPPEPIAQQQQY